MSQDRTRGDAVSPTVTHAPTEGVHGELLAPGQVMGGRYEIRGLLGRGGMGQVWRAFDLKLRMDIALKSLHGGTGGSDRTLEMLRREVRSARAVVSPNVCRIFDLIEADGRELVSMEFVDGQTLLEVLHEHAPLDLKHAQDIASQFLAGLEAIHAAGLVHRDVKPENIMLTRAGRVVVMDFGLARQAADPEVSCSGTPAYMSPEQAEGLEVDARADVYAAGVVLAEMVSPDGVRDRDSRQSLWEGVRAEPPRVPESPWAPVIVRAVAKDRERRPGTAHTLIRQLEDVTLRVEGAEDLRPYPGLASFTEDDAEYFFGREAEVETLWGRLDGPARLLGLVGPSGAGKTSFLRAGVVPAAPSGWAVLRCTPGTSAIASLRRTLVPGLGGDTRALADLASGEDSAAVAACARWRERHDRALLIVDQFEELFTLNDERSQERFVELLRRLPLEADVHVVLSMRDDFLMECHRHEALRPVVSDLMLLDPPVGASLRRAVVQPATRCGYRFEDDALVDEMLAEVEGERGALPLLAFAAAQLWERRDREAGELTRDAYEEIGGVGGSLARHAEATIDRIGSERVPLVRELFRNLVTAEGTRAVREWDDLLSVFDGSGPASTQQGAGRPLPHEEVGHPGVGAGFIPARTPADVAAAPPPTASAHEAAAEVLRALVDARLLTTYDIHDDEHEPVRRVEIIHESLLANWPRLVRWQTQDADAAQLRDQLRQAARTWGDHGRTDDLLWTGAAYREFTVWQERYPGGLSAVEQAFAGAMARHAARRRRRRRAAVAAVVLVSAAAAAVFAGLWQRSEQHARRAEGARLLAIAQLELDRDNTAALAWATASLELADTPEARRFAVEALWRGPMRFEVEPAEDWPRPDNIALCPDGRFLAANSYATDELLVWPEDGGGPLVLGETERTHLGNVWFTTMPTGETVLVQAVGDIFRLRTVPGFELLRDLECPVDYSVAEALPGGILMWGLEDEELVFHVWPFDGGEPTVQRGWQRLDATWWRFDASGESVLFVRGRELVRRPIEAHQSAEHDEVLGRLPADTVYFHSGAPGSPIAVLDSDGLVRLWSRDPDPGHPLAVLRGPGRGFWTDPTGTLLCADSEDERALEIWDITAPPDAEPLVIPMPEGGGGVTYLNYGVDPQRRWLVGQGGGTLFFWPLGGPHPRVLEGDPSRITDLTFLGDSSRLVSASTHSISLWPLSASSGELARELVTAMGNPNGVVASPSGDTLLISRWIFTGVHRMELATGSPELVWPPGECIVWTALAFSPDGRQAAVAASASMEPEYMILRAWDVATWSERVYDLRDAEWSGTHDGEYTGGVSHLQFTPDGGLLSAGFGGVRLWDLENGEAEWLVRTVNDRWMTMSSDRSARSLLTAETVATPDPPVEWEALTLRDRTTGTSRVITSHGELVSEAVLDPTGRIIVTSVPGEGVLQVGSADGSEPHLLYGHTSNVIAIAISPDSRWIASGDEFGEIRLWPMPDVSRPPLHTLPHDELIATLQTLTNLRVVREPGSGDDWKIETARFPGWKQVPEWW